MGSDKGVNFSDEHTIQISDHQPLLAKGVSVLNLISDGLTYSFAATIYALQMIVLLLLQKCFHPWKIQLELTIAESVLMPPLRLFLPSQVSLTGVL